jgi:hypothetical protein
MNTITPGPTQGMTEDLMRAARVQLIETVSGRAS